MMKAGFDKGKSRRVTPAWKALSREINNRRRKIEHRKTKGDLSEIPGLLAEIREFEQKRMEVPTSDSFDPGFRRLLYCRYADDFLIGVIGSKDDVRAVLNDVQQYLAIDLKLTTSPSKTGIRKATKGAAFLGYSVRMYTQRRRQHLWNRGIRKVLSKVARDRVQLHAPIEKLAEFTERNRLGSYHTNCGKMRPEFCNHSDLEIISRYNAMMRGLAEYYKLGTGWRNEIGRLYNVWWRSLVNALARKHKCSAATIFARLHQRDGYGLWYESRTGKRLMRVFALKHVDDGIVSWRNPDQVPVDFVEARSDVVGRLHARICQACGADGPVEVHHAHRLRDVQHRSLRVLVRAARTRKRVVLCVECHRAHHKGRLTARLHELGAGAGVG